MPAVTRQDWRQAEIPWPFANRSQGFDRLALIGPHTGSVHTDLGVGRLQPGGRTDLHVHSYEEAIYVLAGELAVQIDDRAHLLAPGDFAFFPIGSLHGFRNAGGSEARWMDVTSPVALREASGRRDTFFPRDPSRVLDKAVPPDFSDPTLVLVGHYEGTEPDHVGQATAADPRGRSSAGMDTAVLAYSGISVKMLVDGHRGAGQLTMFMVDYEVNGAAQVHDHPFEETYFFLRGDTDFELGGQVHHLGPGDVAWAGVGETHACFNTAGGRVRWIETQAPVPPTRHAYRWPADWDHYERENCR
ncbi:MAG TPA: cupin domain-containing protein [Amycolatopsis sp.]